MRAVTGAEGTGRGTERCSAAGALPDGGTGSRTDAPAGRGTGEAAPAAGDVLGLDLAIVGRACRLPGAPDLPAFWSLLRAGRSAIGRVPADRWTPGKYLARQDDPAGGHPPDGPRSLPRGRAYTDAAGILEDLWDFDAERFAIAPREAAQMDPQQRLALELADTALGEAGMARGAGAGGIDGPRTGVWVGASAMDHAQRFASDAEGIDGPFMTGNTLSVIANRIAHAFDCRGPSLTVDTACASGLTALHMAGAALMRGAVDAAIVVAVNVLLQPFNFVGFSQARMLSPSGRCRPFAADADGYVRAEGGVAFVLMRRETAAATRRPVLSRLVASGIGTDGWTPGLTRPSADAQADLIAAVHRAATLDPAALAFVEAHGTGTPTGDPIEVAALERAFGEARHAAGLPALPIGSVKSNIGHLEPAAGLAGLLKASLALEAGWLPPSIGAGRPDRCIAAARGLTLARRGCPIAPRAMPAAAGVSAFGFGGANAHVVVAAPSADADGIGAARPWRAETPRRPRGTRQGACRGATAAAAKSTLPAKPASVCEGAEAEITLPPLLLCARDDAGLRAACASWRGIARQATGQALAAMVAASGQRAPRHGRRAVVAAARPAALVRALDDLAATLDGGSSPATPRDQGRGARGHGFWLGGAGGVAATTGRAGNEKLPVAFVFAGNGGVWPGMGRRLIARDPAARDAAEAVDSAFAAAGISSPLAAIARARGPTLADCVTAQSTVFTLQVAQVAALRAAGLAPDLVAGHSLGEVAAAWASGRLTLAAAVGLVAARAQAVASLRDTGGMATLATDAATAERLIAEIRATMGSSARPEAGTAPHFLDLAAVNGPRAVTVSGDDASLERLARLARGHRIACLRLAIPYPYHGAALERVRRPLEAAGEGLEGGDAAIPMVSGVDGGPLGDGPPDAAYWWRNARAPVRFDSAIEGLSRLGAGIFVEIGPRPMLARHIERMRSANGMTGTAVLALAGEPGEPGPTARSVVLRALAEGASPDDNAVFGPLQNALPGPGAPPCRSRHRHAPGAGATDLFGLDEARDGVHPRLGFRDRGATGPWFGQLSRDIDPWLDEHRLNGVPVMPAMGWAEIALAAARRVCPPGPVEILELAPAGLLPLLEPRRLKITPSPAGDHIVIEHAATCLQDGGGSAAWRPAARARLRPGAAEAPWPTPDCARGEGGGVVAGAEGPVHPAGSVGPRSSGAAADPSLYDVLATVGLDYGEAFRRAGAPIARDSGPDGSPSGLAGHARPHVFPLSAGGLAAEPAEGLLHPTVLDAALHGLAPLLMPGIGQPGAAGSGLWPPTEPPRAWLPTRIGRLWLAGTLPRDGRPLIVEALLDRRGSESAVARLALRRSTDGAVIAVIDGLVLERTAAGAGGPDAWTPKLVPLVSPTGVDAGRASVIAAAATAAFDRLAEATAARHGADQTEIAPKTLLLDAIADAAEAEAKAEAREGREHDAPAREPLETTVPALVAVAPGSADALIDALNVTDGAETAATGASRLQDTARRMSARIVEETGEALADVSLRVASQRPDTPPMRMGAPSVTTADIVLADRSPGGPQPMLRAGALLLRAGPASDDPEVGPGLVQLRSADVTTLDGALELSLWQAAAPPTKAEPPRHLIWYDVDSNASERSEPDALFEAIYGSRRLAHGVRLQRQGARAGVTAGKVLLVAPPSATPPGRAAADAIAARIALARRIARTPRDKRPAAVVLLARGAFFHGHASGWRAADGALPALRAVMRNELAPLDVRLLDIDPDMAPAAAGAAIAALVDPWLSAPDDNPAVERVLRIGPDGLSAPRYVPDNGDAVTQGKAHGLILRRAGGSARWEAAPDTAASEACLSPRSASGPGAMLGVPAAARTAPADGRLADEDCRQETLPPGRVTIAAVAAGANYRDALWRAGHLPAEAMEAGFCGATLGMECAGRVVAAEPGSTLAPGTPVVALARAAMADLVETDHRLVVPLPAGDRPFWHGALPDDPATACDGVGDPVSVFAAAAALPVAYLTAWHALARLACLTAGERVFVQGGAGGVGLAAIAVARHLGARVVAGAGTPARRRLVRALGAAASVDSRDPALADAVRRAAGGPVDVVLNAAAGAGMRGALEALAPFGRLVELGKRDLYGDADLPLRPFAHSLSLHAFDADRWLAARPDEAGRSLAAILSRIAAGELPMLPHRAVAAEDADTALAGMRRSGHVGKIVILPPGAAEAAAGRHRPTSARPRPASSEGAVAPSAPTAGKSGGPALAEDGATAATGAVATTGAWLVAGTGALAIAMAGTLIDHGIRHLVLISRRGAAAEDVARLVERGARVETHRGDASCPERLRRITADLEAAGTPLSGALHAAMVLEDAALATQTPAGVRRVLTAKIAVAEALDTALAPCGGPLVMIGSVSAWIGTPGQAAYAAANGALEGLAAARQAAGRPSLVLVSGPVVEAGHLAGDRSRGARVARDFRAATGGAPTRLADLQARLARWLRSPGGPPAVAVFGAGTGARRGTLPVFDDPSFDALIVADAAQGSEEGAAGAPADAGGFDWGGLPAERPARRQAVADALLAIAARVLATDPARLPRDRALSALGFDSLMAVEFALAVERHFALTLEAEPLSDGQGIDEMAGRLLDAAHAAGLLAPAVSHAGADGTRAEGLAASDPGRARRRADAPVATPPPAAAPTTGRRGAPAPDRRLARHLAARHVAGLDAPERARLLEAMEATERHDG